MNVMEVYFETLEKVISCSQSPAGDSGDVEVIYRTVLCHPIIKTYFLSLPEMEVLKKKKNLRRNEFISQVVTSHMSRLVKQMPQAACAKLADVLADYVNRLQLNLADVFDSDGSSETSEKSIVALEALEGFLFCIDGDVLVRLIKWFLTLPLDVLADGESGLLTQCGLALTSCLGRLCQLMSSCVVHRMELSHVTIKTLFKLSVHISSDTVNDLLRRFLQTLPLYSICIEFDTFSTYLDGGDDVQLDIVATVMTHSATCRKWFARWGASAGRRAWRLRKERVKYFGVVREYLRNESRGKW